MHNLSNKIPQCSEFYGGLFEKGTGKGCRLLGCLEKNNVILPLGFRGGLREICLFILKGGEIQYSSDGNWIVPDTTCLSLSLSFSLSPFLSRSICSLAAEAVISSYICHNLFSSHCSAWYCLRYRTQTNCLCVRICSSITKIKCVQELRQKKWKKKSSPPRGTGHMWNKLKILEGFCSGIVELRASFGVWLHSHLHYSKEADGLTFPYSETSQQWLETVAQAAEPSAWVCLCENERECVPQGLVLLKAPIDRVSK